MLKWFKPSQIRLMLTHWRAEWPKATGIRPTENKQSPDFLESAFRINKKTRSKDREWRKPIKLGCVAALLVLILNLALFAYTLAHSEHIDDHGVFILYTGNCNTSRNIALWSHLTINVLSSVLLAAGNVCTQCLAAPTRSEIDKAHAKHQWLDIGVNTIRNLKAISVSRKIAWALLAVSSVPLHLLYNSVIFKADFVNDYLVGTVSASFIDGGHWSEPRAACFPDNGPSSVHTLEYLQRNIDDLTQLDPSTCFDTYATTGITKWANLLIIVDDPPYDNETLLNTFQLVEQYYEDDVWVCTESDGAIKIVCNSQGKLINASNWLVPRSLNPMADNLDPYDGSTSCLVNPNGTFLVNRCLAQPTPEACQLGVCPAILISVLICNLVKIICMLWTIWLLDFDPLVTLGDVVASFLSCRDFNTYQCGIMTANVETWMPGVKKPVETVWRSREQNGFQSASTKRWLVCSALFILFWVLGLWALVFVITTRISEAGFGVVSTIMSDGIGRMSENLGMNLTTKQGTILGNVIIANTPQLLVSLLYLLYSGLFTRMHIAMQWSSFVHSRKTLHVAFPRGDKSKNVGESAQRQQYILSLPLRTALPLLVLTMLLHWLVSQSIFLAFLGARNWISTPEPPVKQGYSVFGIGWSPLALILSLPLGGLMVLGLWMNAQRLKHGKGIPVVKTCSAAISAACHPPALDVDTAEKPLAYGAVEISEFDQDGREKVYLRACLTSLPVIPLVDGEKYS